MVKNKIKLFTESAREDALELLNFLRRGGFLLTETFISKTYSFVYTNPFLIISKGNQYI